MRALVAGAILALLATPANAALLFTGFTPGLPDSGGADAFEITNTGPASVPLANVSVTGGEGRLGFDPGATLAAGAHIVVTTNATAYSLAARHEADYAPADANGTTRVLDAGFALGHDGDDLRLEDASGIADVVVWGDSTHAGPGWNGPPLNATGSRLRWFTRTPGQDSDTKADWEQPRQARLGWRLPETPTFPVQSGVAFVAPDSSRAMVLDVLLRASSSLRLNVYEFLDVGVANDLLDHMRAHAGLEVRLLVDENPVGMSAEARLVRDRILRDLEEAGAQVHLMQHARYAYDHAKYAVVDDRWVLVQSENLVSGALPTDARHGNRGWGLALDAPTLAQSLAGVFDEDFALDPYGARELSDDEPAPVPLPTFVSDAPHPRLEPASGYAFNATLATSPESLMGDGDPLLDAIARARHEILVEQLNVPPTWRDAAGRDWPNEYLNALVEAARRGVQVRLLLDGHFLDAEGSPNDNAATLRSLESPGRLLPIQGRLMRDPDEGVLHVKGVVIDGQSSWVGSMNWNLNSVAQNREVSLLVDAKPFAELFADAFESDWDRAQEQPSTRSPVPGLGFPLVAIVITLAGFAFARRRAS